MQGLKEGGIGVRTPPPPPPPATPPPGGCKNVQKCAKNAHFGGGAKIGVFGCFWGVFSVFSRGVWVKRISFQNELKKRGFFKGFFPKKKPVETRAASLKFFDAKIAHPTRW